jgi:hypothetical protein
VKPDGAVCPLLIRLRRHFCSGVNDVKGQTQTFFGVGGFGEQLLRQTGHAQAISELIGVRGVSGGLEARGDIAMFRKTDAVVARTIGIDTGKNTLHLIGLDDKGTIVLREKVARTDRRSVCQCATLSDWHRGRRADALCGSPADCAWS